MRPPQRNGPAVPCVQESGCNKKQAANISIVNNNSLKQQKNLLTGRIKMNSLTSVGGHVIESEELNSMQDRLSKTGTTSPRNFSGSGRMNKKSSPRDSPMRPSTSSSPGGTVSPAVAKSQLRRQSNAPSAVTIDTDEGSNTKIKIPIRPPDLRLPPRSPPPRSPRFKKKSFSTTASSFSPSSTAAAAPPQQQQTHHDNSHIINLLETLSQQESFQTSSYFRGVFRRGIDKMKEHTHEKLTTIEEALELCFDVSDDMRKVIATKIQADEMMATMMNSPAFGDRDIDITSSIDNNMIMTNDSSSEVNNNSNNTNISNSNSSNKAKPWDSSPRVSNNENKKLRPWEIDGAKSNRRPSVQEYMQQIEERIQLTYGGIQFRPKETVENQPSVVRANAALEVAVETEKKIRSPFDEALVSPRLVRTSRKGGDDNDVMSLMDEALVSPRLVRRKGVNNHNHQKMMSFDEVEVAESPRSRPVVAQNNKAGMFHASEHFVKELEIIDEKKQLLDEKKRVFQASEHLVKELELLDDKKRISLELEKSKQELDLQKQEVETVKGALNEAKMAVKTLEETVSDLKKATREKDEKIYQLTSKVKQEELASAGSQEAHQEQVKELGTAVAQLNMLVKKMEAESKEADARLAEAVEKYNKSEEVLKMLQLTMTKRDEEQADIIEKLENERDDLVDELESCKETMTTSLENTTKQMDGIINQKDKLIYSLSAKIELLEGNLEDLKEAKLEGEVSAADKEKELNEKIHELATTLIGKDEMITSLEKEIQDLKLSAKKEKKRSEKRERRETKHRSREDQDIDSRQSSFESKEERSRRQRSRSRHRRRSYSDDVREARPHKADRFSARERYSTPEPEPYYQDERDDGYGYPERDTGALFSPIDDDSYIYRRHM